jgi:hypothetical protein
MGVILGLAIAFGFLLLPLSIYPGLIAELTFIALVSAPFWLPAVCISCWLYVDMIYYMRDLHDPPPGRRRRLAAMALVLLLNCCLLWCDAPRRLAFLQARKGFEACLAAAPVAYSSVQRCDRRFGVYLVERYAADSRGGVYFLTRSASDGFSTRRMDYGFTYRPNLFGSPFGDEKYVLSHVVDDWYAFRASQP